MPPLFEPQVTQLVREKTADPLAILKACGGYYLCPKDADGKRCGPLVGYAGRDKETGKQFVGDIYANFAKVEQYPGIVHHFAYQLLPKLALTERADVYLGAPEGGKSLADKLAQILTARYCYPEKKVIAVATEDTREKSKLVWGRHELFAGERVAIVEDVSNNFSTANEIVELILAAEACPVALITFLNRSPNVDRVFTSASGYAVPVVSLVRFALPEYRQEDPAVADDIARGNVVWKPKDEWETFAQFSA